MELLATCQEIQTLSTLSIQKINELITEKQVPKGEHLLTLWQIPRHLFFIKQGAARVYYLKEGQDITDYLALDGQFIGGVPSLFWGTPSHKAIEVLEDSIIQSIYYPTVEKLCEEHLDIANLGRKLNMFAFLEGQKHMEDMRFLSVAERYDELLKQYPNITNRILLKHIASYLGTTQVSISRVRSGEQ